jgi:hypothetical protein
MFLNRSEHDFVAHAQQLLLSSESSVMSVANVVSVLIERSWPLAHRCGIFPQAMR